MKKVKISFFNNLPVWLRRTIAGVLITALIGGVLACLIAPPVRRALEK